MIHYDTYCIHLISMWFFPCGTCGGMTGQNFSGRFPYTKPTTCLLSVRYEQFSYLSLSLTFVYLVILTFSQKHGYLLYSLCLYYSSDSSNLFSFHSRLSCRTVQFTSIEKFTFLICVLSSIIQSWHHPQLLKFLPILWLSWRILLTVLEFIALTQLLLLNLGKN